MFAYKGLSTKGPFGIQMQKQLESLAVHVLKFRTGHILVDQSLVP